MAGETGASHAQADRIARAVRRAIAGEDASPGTVALALVQIEAEMLAQIERFAARQEMRATMARLRPRALSQALANAGAEPEPLVRSRVRRWRSGEGG